MSFYYYYFFFSFLPVFLCDAPSPARPSHLLSLPRWRSRSKVSPSVWTAFLHSSAWPLAMLPQSASSARAAKGAGWLQEGVNCNLTGNLCNETCTQVPLPLTARRQKLNWQSQPFLIIIKAACFFSLTRDSRRQLLMETLIGSLQIALGLYTSTYWKEEEKKKNRKLHVFPALFLTCCSSRKPKALLLSYAPAAGAD